MEEYDKAFAKGIVALYFLLIAFMKTFASIAFPLGFK